MFACEVCSLLIAWLPSNMKAGGENLCLHEDKLVLIVSFLFRLFKALVPVLQPAQVRKSVGQESQSRLGTIETAPKSGLHGTGLRSSSSIQRSFNAAYSIRRSCCTISRSLWGQVSAETLARPNSKEILTSGPRDDRSARRG